MDSTELLNRTKQFAVTTVQFCKELPNTVEFRVIKHQIIKSATSVGANYRAACRGKSNADMINKLKIVEEEADETLYWMELIVEANLLPEQKLVSLVSEMNNI